MNKKSVSVILILLCLLLFFYVTGNTDNTKKSDTDTDSFYSFTDSLGNEVTLTKKPERVAVLFSSLCNVWKNAGGESFITVGESIDRGFCDEETLLVDSGAGKSINTELLISYEPDFVIYSSDVPAQTECGRLLEKAGIPSAAIRLDSFEDYLSALRIFCDITEKDENYRLYGEGIKKDIDYRLKTAKRLKEEPKILFIRSGSNKSSCKAKKADDHFAAKMLEDLGCVNIADSAPVLLDGLSVEEVLINKPDFIFVSLMGDEEAGKAYMESVLSSDAWRSLDCFVIYLPKDLFQYKPCEKWNLAYDCLAEIIYPVLFAV